MKGFIHIVQLSAANAQFIGLQNVCDATSFAFRQTRRNAFNMSMHIPPVLREGLMQEFHVTCFRFCHHLRTCEDATERFSCYVVRRVESREGAIQGSAPDARMLCFKIFPHVSSLEDINM